jgi:hypothetical protein
VFNCNATDLFVVPTIGFDLLYAFIIIRLDRQRSGNHQSGQKIVPDAAREACVRCGYFRHIRRHCLARFQVEIAHGASLFHRDRFREVTWLIDIGADRRSGMIRNQLDRNGVDERRHR